MAAIKAEIPPQPRLRLWTDDYSSLLPILNLRAERKAEPESKPKKD